MITVIIPVYNVEKYLKQCLDSVFHQSYKSIQVIIVNDGSTDNSKNIIVGYKENYNFIYLEQQNKGVSEARNLALKYVNGDYILFVDPDDYLEIDCLELMHNKAIKTNSDIVIASYTSIFDDDIKGMDFSYKIQLDENIIYNNVQIINKMLDLNILGYLWNKLFKTTLCNKVKLNFESSRYVQDWLPVFIQVSEANTISFIDKSLYNYRQRGASTVNKNNEKLLIDYNHAVTSIINYLEKRELPYDKNKMTMFKATTLYQVIVNYYTLNKNMKFKMYIKYKNSFLNKHKINMREILFSKHISKHYKKTIFLWKIKLYHIYIEIRPLIKKFINLKLLNHK